MAVCLQPGAGRQPSLAHLFCIDWLAEEAVRPSAIGNPHGQFWMAG